MRRLLAIPFLLVLAACGGGAGQSASSGAAPIGGGAAPAQHAQAAAAGSNGTSADTSSVPAVPVTPSDKLIRTAQVTLVVSSGRFDDALNQLVALTEREGGFVSGSQASTTEDRLRQGVFTFSVPSDQFEATLGSLHGMGKVQAENVSSQDVAQQYVDLQARLKNAEAQRDAMLALLQRATQINDIITVQNQVGQITAQIEQLKGQINYLDHATAFSTITVTLREQGVVAAPPSDAANLRDALSTGLHAFLVSLAAILVVAVAAGPYALVLGAGLLLWTQRRRFGRTVSK